MVKYGMRINKRYSMCRYDVSYIHPIFLQRLTRTFIADLHEYINILRMLCRSVQCICVCVCVCMYVVAANNKRRAVRGQKQSAVADIRSYRIRMISHIYRTSQ
jgi:predicted nuclease with RNAse H fold